MNKNTVTVILPIQGMTCGSCESHINMTLEKTSASNVKTSYRKRETRFQIEETELEKVKALIAEETGYKVGKEKVLTSTEELDNENEDLNQKGFLTKIKEFFRS
jgi:copper chaperone CopZ